MTLLNSKNSNHLFYIPKLKSFLTPLIKTYCEASLPIISNLRYLKKIIKILHFKNDIIHWNDKYYYIFLQN